MNVTGLISAKKRGFTDAELKTFLYTADQVPLFVYYIEVKYIRVNYLMIPVPLTIPLVPNKYET